MEYLLLVLPVAGALASFHDWGAAMLTLALSCLAAWLPARRESQRVRHRARSLFRSEAFEWVSGLRAGGAGGRGPGGVAIYFAGLSGTPEPVTMLVLATRTPKQFLRRRLGLGVGYAAALGRPVFLVAGSGAGR
ncbi:hypothetical protein [Hymenobacter siberiensis]|uniref:hypothetical protein n=1 Tax=Hymenobacter siberiensis TaxID=2848396 RepID=UPI001C1E7320|nr:hypothetical protein [Hymenobacter siberiensis]MBU6121589.1 hypothetical protein [Hymenobacter siberiensis]